MKNKVKLKKLFLPVHIFIYFLLLIPLMMQQYEIFIFGLIIFHSISFIWRILILKQEDTLSINNVIGAVIVYGFGFYFIWRIGINNL